VPLSINQIYCIKQHFAIVKLRYYKNNYLVISPNRKEVFKKYKFIIYFFFKSLSIRLKPALKKIGVLLLLFAMDNIPLE
jgi:hypothetical protein